MGIKSIIYQWNGSEADGETLDKAEKFAKNLFENTKEKCMYVQMTEFDETTHFLQIFEGKLIILQSDRNPKLNNKTNNNFITSDGQILLQDYFVLKVHGDASYNCKSVEVNSLGCMSSKECYVLKTAHCWVWCGSSSTGDAREMAKNVGALLGESSLVLEGKEPKEFWRSISHLTQHPQLAANGALEHNSSFSSSSSRNSSNNSTTGSISPLNASSASSSGYLSNSCSNSKANRPLAQLFLVWKQKDKCFNQEIIGYEQADLSPECVYVMDAGLITYVWLGQYASAMDRQNYWLLVQCYLESVPIARRPTTAVAVIRQHDEPNVFKGLFENWNHNLWNVCKDIFAQFPFS